MQEEVENRTLNLAISTTKLSGRALLVAFRKYMQHRRNVKAKKIAAANEKPVGEQTIDQLLGQNQGATNIEIEKTDIRGFKRFLDKYGIDYAITKNPSQTPPRYLVFFKARDGDAMTAAFKEYSASLLQKQKKPSVLKQLNKLKQLVASMPAKVRQCLVKPLELLRYMTWRRIYAACFISTCPSLYLCVFIFVKDRRICQPQ